MRETIEDRAPAVIVTDLLNTLAVLYDRRRMAALAIDDQIAELQARRTAATASLDAEIAPREAQIKALVSEIGVTIKAGDYQAVYTQGRVTWDSKMLEGYARAHQEIMYFRHEGAPSVSIRPVREGGAQ